MSTRRPRLSPGALPLLLLGLVLLSLGAAGAEGLAPALTPDSVRQGGLVRMACPLQDEGAVSAASVVFGGVTARCFAHEGALVGLFAVAARTKPGSYTAKLCVRYADGRYEQYPLPLAVTAASFPTQHIRMPRGKTGLMSQSILDKEHRILFGAMGKPTAEPLWEGAFANPLAGRISSPFGRKRYVNGRFWGQHGGRDVASPAGRPVAATNGGRVVVARKLWMRGNTVMIDHGMGVYSLYNHLSRISVQPGQAVRKGEVIGLVGATGFSTGPHLHWEIRIHGTPTDPAGPLSKGIPLGS